MEIIVANPTWIVPRSIAVKEYLPMPEAEPECGWASQDHRPLAGGWWIAARWISPHTTSTISPSTCKQPPSAGNALGKVKFLFPNRWNIYLHDTPAKSLFSREVRAFSHGCIRLADPFNFAYTVLARADRDPKGLFKSHLNTGASRRYRSSSRAGASDLPHRLYHRQGPDRLSPRRLWPRRADSCGAAEGRGGAGTVQA